MYTGCAFKQWKSQELINIVPPLKNLKIYIEQTSQPREVFSCPFDMLAYFFPILGLTN